MITEDYVSFETAKLLKEKGFSQSTFRCHYRIDGNSHYKSFENRCGFGDYNIIAPTLAMAMKWLREVHKLYINIWADPKDVENNNFDIIFRAQVYNGSSNYGIYDFSTYEQACEAAIKYCLENLI